MAIFAAMKQSEKISVVIPVLQRARLVVRCLDSIAAQTMLPARVVVVDNGSTDGTPQAVAEWAAGHPAVALELLSCERKGASAARNTGLERVGTDYVMFFDSDDVMLPGHIARVNEFLDIVPDLDIVYYDRAVRDDDHWTRVLGVSDTDILRGHLLDCSLATLAYTARTDLVRRAGGWDEQLPRWNDYELGTRLLLEAGSVRKLPGDPTVLVYPQADSISGTDYSHSAPALERALDLAAMALRKSGKLHHLKYVYARRSTLAALYAREGDAEGARRLLGTALDNPPGGLRTLMALQLINLAVRLSGHGGSAIARMLLREKKPSERKSLLRRRD